MTNQEEEVAHDKSAPDELKRGKIPDDGSCITQSDQGKDMDKTEGRDAICRLDDQMANLEEVAHDKSAPDELKQGKIPDDGSCITQSDQGKDTDKSEGRDAICRLDDQMANLEEVIHDKSAPDKLKQGKIPDDGSCITQSDQRKDTDKSEGRDADKSAPLELKNEKIPDDGVCIPHSDRGNDEDEGTPNELKLEKIHDDGCSISQTDREKDVAKLPVSDAKLEIILYDGPTDILELTPRAENTPVHAEKAPEDGFNWRKYGQKNVRANEFVRSYYRCTYPFCQAKRQVERSHDGQITDTVYLGHHSHPPINSPAAVNPPVSPTSKKSDKSPVTNVKEKASELKIPAYPPVSSVPRSEAARPPHKDEEKRVVLQMDKIPDEVTFNGSPLVLKKKKRGPDNANPLGGDTPSSEARTVVHTVSEVDIVHDGHRWRKYGQKMVKGNTNPRSYYRCSLVGCPARKLVERASHDQKVVITTYEGQHLHRTDGSAAISPSHTEDTKKQSDNTESARAIIVAEAGTTRGKVDEECHRKGKKRAYISHLVGFDMFVVPGPESKSDEKPIHSSSGNLGDSDKAGHGPFSDAKDEHTHAQPHTNNAAAVRS